MVFFADVVSAFYGVVREVVMPLKHCELDHEELIDQLEIPVAFEEAMVKLLQEPDLMSRYVGDEHLLALTTEAHRFNWFVVEGSSKVAWSRKGSVPGKRAGRLHLQRRGGASARRDRHQHLCCRAPSAAARELCMAAPGGGQRGHQDVTRLC